MLPHVVLTTPTLPWQWTLTGGPQKPDATGDVYPWMALLVFDAEDPAPVAAAGTLARLMSTSSSGWVDDSPNVVSYPGLKQLDPWEAATDPVVTIDVPVDLFNQVAPSADDLIHLAHSRRTSPENKASDAGNAQGEYSVVIANRLPSGQRTTVHLVCLEGMEKYLPGAGQSLPPDTKSIRLASLKSWQFTATPEKVSFEGSLRLVMDPDHPGTLRLPCSGSSVQAVTDALSLGYTACAHQTRLGASTVSWYRGPLVPFEVNTQNRLATPANNADALLRYDPTTGMFDTSYSAAWQLGRLLALQNKEFAVALYQWKHANRAGPQNQLQDPPDVVNNWLGRLSLLHGVPFNYLVPDERMLPPESLRFFQMDRFWMDCLMDGAYSMGRSTSAVATRDQTMLGKIQANAITAARQQRLNWLNQAGVDPPQVTTGDGISGFLLRSKVVSAYPGMEVRALTGTSDGDEGSQVAILRLESISPNVLLGLFNGPIGHLRIRQAPEGVHFGLDFDTEKNQFTRLLRDPSNGKETGSSASATFRDGGKQVIDMTQLAASIASQLKAASVTSELFALEMIEGVSEVFFVNKS